MFHKPYYAALDNMLQFPTQTHLRALSRECYDSIASKRSLIAKQLHDLRPKRPA